MSIAVTYGYSDGSEDGKTAEIVKSIRLDSDGTLFPEDGGYAAGSARIHALIAKARIGFAGNGTIAGRIKKLAGIMGKKLSDAGVPLDTRSEYIDRFVRESAEAMYDGRLTAYAKIGKVLEIMREIGKESGADLRWDRRSRLAIADAVSGLRRDAIAIAAVSPNGPKFLDRESFDETRKKVLSDLSESVIAALSENAEKHSIYIDRLNGDSEVLARTIEKLGMSYIKGTLSAPFDEELVRRIGKGFYEAATKSRWQVLEAVKKWAEKHEAEIDSLAVSNPGVNRAPVTLGPSADAVMDASFSIGRMVAACEKSEKSFTALSHSDVDGVPDGRANSYFVYKAAAAVMEKRLGRSVSGEELFEGVKALAEIASSPRSFDQMDDGRLSLAADTARAFRSLEEAFRSRNLSAILYFNPFDSVRKVIEKVEGVATVSRRDGKEAFLETIDGAKEDVSAASSVVTDTAIEISEWLEEKGVEDAREMRTDEIFGSYVSKLAEINGESVTARDIPVAYPIRSDSVVEAAGKAFLGISSAAKGNDPSFGAVSLHSRSHSVVRTITGMNEMDGDVAPILEKASEALYREKKENTTYAELPEAMKEAPPKKEYAEIAAMASLADSSSTFISGSVLAAERRSDPRWKSSIWKKGNVVSGGIKSDSVKPILADVDDMSSVEKASSGRKLGSDPVSMRMAAVADAMKTIERSAMEIVARTSTGVAPVLTPGRLDDDPAPYASSHGNAWVHAGEIARLIGSAAVVAGVAALEKAKGVGNDDAVKLLENIVSRTPDTSSFMLMAEKYGIEMTDGEIEAIRSLTTALKSEEVPTQRGISALKLARDPERLESLSLALVSAMRKIADAVEADAFSMKGGSDVRNTVKKQNNMVLSARLKRWTEIAWRGLKSSISVFRSEEPERAKEGVSSAIGFLKAVTDYGIRSTAEKSKEGISTASPTSVLLGTNRVPDEEKAEASRKFFSRTISFPFENSFLFKHDLSIEDIVDANAVLEREASIFLDAYDIASAAARGGSPDADDVLKNVSKLQIASAVEGITDAAMINGTFRESLIERNRKIFEKGKSDNDVIDGMRGAWPAIALFTGHPAPEKPSAAPVKIPLYPVTQGFASGVIFYENARAAAKKTVETKRWGVGEIMPAAAGDIAKAVAASKTKEATPAFYSNYSAVNMNVGNPGSLSAARKHLVFFDENTSEKANRYAEKNPFAESAYSALAYTGHDFSLKRAVDRILESVERFEKAEKALRVENEYEYPGWEYGGADAKNPVYASAVYRIAEEFSLHRDAPASEKEAVAKRVAEFFSERTERWGMDKKGKEAAKEILEAASASRFSGGFVIASPDIVSGGEERGEERGEKAAAQAARIAGFEASAVLPSKIDAIRSGFDPDARRYDKIFDFAKERVEKVGRAISLKMLGVVENAGYPKIEAILAKAMRHFAPEEAKEIVREVGNELSRREAAAKIASSHGATIPVDMAKNMSVSLILMTAGDRVAEESMMGNYDDLFYRAFSMDFRTFDREYGTKIGIFSAAALGMGADLAFGTINPSISRGLSGPDHE